MSRPFVTAPGRGVFLTAGLNTWCGGQVWHAAAIMPRAAGQRVAVFVDGLSPSDVLDLSWMR